MIIRAMEGNEIVDVAHPAPASMIAESNRCNKHVMASRFDSAYKQHHVFRSPLGSAARPAHYIPLSVQERGITPEEIKMPVKKG